MSGPKKNPNVDQLVNRFTHLETKEDISVNVAQNETNSRASSVSGDRRRRRKRNKAKKSENTNTSVLSDPEQPDSAHIDPINTDNAMYPLDSLAYLKPRGFQNVRNSCYLNASLQMLLQIPQFCRLLLGIQRSGYVDQVLTVSSGTAAKGTQSGRLLPLMLNLFREFSLVWSQTKPSSHSTSEPNKVHLKEADPVKPQRTPKDPSDLNGIGHEKRLPVRPFNLGSPVVLSGDFFHVLNLQGGFQEDCAECLTHMLTKLHEETTGLSNTGTKVENHQFANATAANDDGDDGDGSDWIVTDRTGKRRPEARRTELDGGSSPISHLFSGVLVNRSTVTHAKHASSRRGAQSSFGPHAVSVDTLTRNATCVSTKEPFFILPLEINDPKVTTVESALLVLSDREELSDYLDALTGMPSTVRRHACLDQLPPFLLLQLKRFSVSSTSPQARDCDSAHGSATAPGWTLGKSLKSISIQPELLVPIKLLNNETRFSVEQRRYRLRAVIFHVGLTPSSGHYTVAVRWDHNRSDTTPGLTHDTSTCPFLYLDDTHACLIPNTEALRLLFTTHRPLDPRTGTFHQLPKELRQSPNNRVPISEQPRTPYILVYQSALTPETVL